MGTARRPGFAQRRKRGPPGRLPRSLTTGCSARRSAHLRRRNPERCSPDKRSSRRLPRRHIVARSRSTVSGKRTSRRPRRYVVRNVITGGRRPWNRSPRLPTFRPARSGGTLLVNDVRGPDRTPRAGSGDPGRDAMSSELAVGRNGRPNGGTVKRKAGAWSHHQSSNESLADPTRFERATFAFGGRGDRLAAVCVSLRACHTTLK